ncbi:hypothetical protein BKA67DRAFT_273391 [Truncatella angustata]|uniref:Uncharacterized protein n=1 Tax=Truncatella angustata TaxID=152316 RepID=A0A9P8ULG9_9PEZI|nr:uncharacterized protein BKA67DRAFT_273391 [Truncatella angustata]KAH6654256.1 hypothetical protein BKA67DRAFT_273391 [Truncatella angustata]
MLLLGLEQSQRLDPLKSPKVASLRSVTPLNANRAGAERQPLALALVRPFVITPQLQKGAAVVGAGACVLAKEEDDCDASLTRRASHHHHHRRCRRQAFPSTPPSSSVEKDRGCSKPFCAPRKEFELTSARHELHSNHNNNRPESQSLEQIYQRSLFDFNPRCIRNCRRRRRRSRTCTPAAPVSSQRLHTDSLDQRNCHQPP